MYILINWKPFMISHREVNGSVREILSNQTKHIVHCLSMFFFIVIPISMTLQISRNHYVINLNHLTISYNLKNLIKLLFLLKHV